MRNHNGEMIYGPDSCVYPKPEISKREIVIGYYWVKFYNHADIQLRKFNGKNFEGFKSDLFIDDEIERYEPVSKDARSLFQELNEKEKENQRLRESVRHLTNRVDDLNSFTKREASKLCRFLSESQKRE